jgi:hypothetical protein
VLTTNFLKLLTSKRSRKKLLKRLIIDPNSIRKSDYVFVSYPKSGRTWVRAMISRLYHTRYGTPDNILIRLDNLAEIDKRIPKIFFTHDGESSASVDRLDPDKSIYDGRNTVFMARHPGDVIVSMYYHHRHRKPHHSENYAARSDLFTFAVRADHGIHTVIAFMNHWMRYAKGNPRVRIIRYEDMRQDPALWLKQITDHFGGDFTTEELEDAVAFGAFDNLKKLERARYFDDAHLQARNNEDPQSFKVRSGKIGGYAEHFTDAQRKEIDKIIKTSLDEALAY